MMDTNLAQALGEIQRSLGSIEGKLDGHMTAFKQHVADDAAMAADIKKLQLDQARTKGVMSSISAASTFVGSIIGAALGIIGDRWLMGRH